MGIWSECAHQVASSYFTPLSTDGYNWALSLDNLDKNNVHTWFQAGIITGLAPDGHFYSSPTFYVETQTTTTYTFQTFVSVLSPFSSDTIAIYVAGGIVTGAGNQVQAWLDGSLIYDASDPFPSGQEFVPSAFLEIHQAGTNYGVAQISGSWSNLLWWGANGGSFCGGYSWGNLYCGGSWSTNSKTFANPNPPTPYYITSVSQTSFNAGLPQQGGGAGSVASGTLITMVDGSQVPVQNLKVGAVMVGYNTTTGQYTTSVIKNIYSVTTSNMLVINTANGTPFRVDANPAQTLWVRMSSYTGWMPVTQIRVGDSLFTQNSWVQVTDMSYAPSGRHTMYDIIATAPYFASGYLDLQHKN